MQVRDLIQELQQFDPRSEVVIETNDAEADWRDVHRHYELKHGPDTCRIVVEVS